MRRMLATMLLPAAVAIALAAPRMCPAQSRPVNPRPLDPGAATADGQPATHDDSRRSPFGKVMAVMIAALQHQSTQPAHPGPKVRTTATGTPLGIHVGTAFALPPASSATAKPQAPPALPGSEPPPPTVATELARTGLAGTD